MHDGDGRVTAQLSLLDHSRDVSAVMLALIELPGIKRRLDTLAGGGMTARTAARLAYLTFLHDCGKLNRGFQARRDPQAPVVGHIRPLCALFGRRPAATLMERGYQAFGVEALELWGTRVTDLLDAVFSHHGRPWPHDELGEREARYWLPGPDCDPVASLRELRAEADRRFPEAHGAGQGDLPDSEPFVHAVAGLVQLADWIASSGWLRDRRTESDGHWAARQLRQIGVDPGPWRTGVTVDRADFASLFDGSPYHAQSATRSAHGRLLILESETGSGKTEAALYRFARLFAEGEVDGLYFALPTRTAAAQIYGRVQRFLNRLWPNGNAPPHVLAVPGYLTDSADGALPVEADGMDAPEGDERHLRTWAAEHPKRYFSALVGVGTIDQALLCALRVKHAHLRGSLLMRHFLVVDEVHASDPYMRVLLQQLLRDHLRAGGHALLLSATLGGEVRDAFLTAARGDRPRDGLRTSISEAVKRPYPLLTSALTGGAHDEPLLGFGRKKEVSMHEVPAIDDPAAIAAIALDAARQGAKVLVIRNSVATAVAVQQALEEAAGPEDPLLFRLAGRRALHHGRFAREDRRALDGEVQRIVGKERAGGGCVVVGTQTLEQSLDIDADLLISDLCPVDVLLQRLGRLHRHHRHERPPAYSTAQVKVLVPAEGLAPFLGPHRRGRRHGLGFSRVGRELRGVYPDLLVLEATRRLLSTQPVWRIPELNRLLVESALHTGASEALLASIPTGEREVWQKHRSELAGHVIALGQVASDGLLRRDVPFMEQGVLDEMYIATRLGSRDRLVDLPAETIGPFGWEVRRLAIPHWMLPAVPADAVPQVRVVSEGRVHLEWEDATLVYDRFGLRPERTQS